MIERLSPDEELVAEPMLNSEPAPALATWHTAHKDNLHWIEKSIEWVLVAVGSVASIVIHTVWFCLWFQFHLDVALLTNIVSLEAIILSVLIMIDGRNKDKQAASQALHFQQTMDALEAKLDKLLES